MSNPALQLPAGSAELPLSIQAAARRIAPAWPLDTAIAVNPWWPMRDRPFSEVAAKLENLAEVKCLMPKSYYRSAWQKTIQREHLLAAINESDLACDVEQLVAFLQSDELQLSHWHNFSELLDALPEHAKRMPWRDEIIHQISQFCGAYFQYPEQIQSEKDQPFEFYLAWLEVARCDKGIEILMAERGLHRQFADLPDCPKKLCEKVIREMGSPENFVDYGHALLLDVHGWASWLAYTAWQDHFSGQANHLVEQLLAIRLAWDWVLWRHAEKSAPHTFSRLKNRFIDQFSDLETCESLHRNQQRELWIWQRALEISYQSKLQQKLLTTKASDRAETPALQAAFCIDVRSESMRRALEAQNPAIETLGFAGFFGLPIEYAPNHGNYRRPQLPGLLTPGICAQQVGREGHLSSNKHLSHHLDTTFDTAPASLGMVEMLGFLKAGKLLKNSFWPSRPGHPANELCDNRTFELSRDGKPLSLKEKVDIASTVMTNMGLTGNIAPVVLLVGHGSCTANNPQAAGLDCGACGGQTGEVNVKVLAQLLNDREIRHGLLAKHIVIPEDTQFVAALHNTTTDELISYGHTADAPWQEWLKNAGRAARQQRAASFDIAFIVYKLK